MLGLNTLFVMIQLTAVGYVTGQPKIESGDYGESCTISIRAKGAGGKHTFFVNAKFFGKQMATIEKYINDSDQVTVSGTVGLVTEKTSQKDGSKYSCVYMNGSAFSLPPKERSSSGRSANSPSEEEVPF